MERTATDTSQHVQEFSRVYVYFTVVLHNRLFCAVKMIIPCLYLKQGTLVDPSSGQSVKDVPSYLEKVSLCPEFAMVFLDTEKETKEFGKKLFNTGPCCAECEFGNEDELIDLLDSGVNRVIIRKDRLTGFSEFISKERITCQLSGAENSIEELTREISSIKERASCFLLPMDISKVDEQSLVEFAKEVKSICGDARLILSVNLNEVISYTAISKLHSLGIDVQISANRLSNELSLGQIIVSCLKSDRPDGLFPTLVVSARWGECAYYINVNAQWRWGGGISGCEFNLNSGKTCSTPLSKILRTTFPPSPFPWDYGVSVRCPWDNPCCIVRVFLLFL